MRYSVLNRFRGALLGSFLGEILGSSSDQGQALGGATLLSPTDRDAQLHPTLSDWSQIATCGTESLIRRGQLDLEDWVLHLGITQPSLLALKTSATSSEAALAMLPIALFFHEDEVKLRQHLLKAVALWQQNPDSAEGVLAIALAIALALTEKLNVATLIPRILTYLDTAPTPLVQQLTQVQTLLEQDAGLETTLRQLRREHSRSNHPVDRSYTSVALAIYCFLHTPKDFRLCVTRAVRTGYQPQITAALTGALSGVYNSIIGIPVGWRLAATRISTGVQRLQLADHLLAVWSGVYDASTTEPLQQAAVAAPYVIQPR